MINKEQYIQMLATQLAVATSLYDNGDDSLADRIRYTQRELILQHNPVITRMARDGAEYLGCVEFADHLELEKLRDIANGHIEYTGLTITKNILVVDLYDEFNKQWYNLNLDEPSIFSETVQISDSIRNKEFAAVTYHRGLKYFMDDSTQVFE